MLTEGANGDFSSQHANDWNLGENYGLNMIHDFNNGAVAWTDWNILLDENGGPNHVGNFSFAPIHANTKEGTLHYIIHIITSDTSQNSSARVRKEL